MKVLSARKDFTLDGLRDAAFDSYQTWFEKPIPALIKAWDDAPASNPLKTKLADQIAMLRTWDLRWGASSIPTSLAVFWGSEVQRAGGRGNGGAANAAPDVMLQALATVSDRLTADFGTWKTPWG